MNLENLKPQLPGPQSPAPNRGFTLVELLIVVAIIAILAAIAIPQFEKYRAKAMVGALSSDLKNAYLAAQGYLMERDSATISDGGSLNRHGFKTTKHIVIDSIDISLNSGSIKLKHTGLDLNMVSSQIGVIYHDGKKGLPTFK